MRKHKKTRTTQLLTMDELRARPCEVDGVPALFHRWVEEDRVILKIEAHVHKKTRLALGQEFNECGICPNGCNTEVIRETFALVEYKDGTIHKVKPELIRFIGKEEQHGT